jgi:hypothetical protein
VIVQRRQQEVVEAAVLRFDERVGSVVDRAHLLGDGQAIGPGLIGAQLQSLLQTSDADLEELVEIARGDAQELEPLEQRDLLVARLREHAPIEFEQRQLTVDVVLGRAEIGQVHATAFWFERYESTGAPGLM